MDKKERIKEFEKLLKGIKIDKAMALNAHQYELVAKFNAYEKNVLAEKEFLEKEDQEEELS